MATAVLAVAATYFYFLIFAQFGFLKAVRAVVGEDDSLLRPIMAMMGISGIAGSLLAARAYAETRARVLMFGGFTFCGMAAGMSLAAGSPGWLFLCAALTGVGAGAVTVTLAAMLQREVGVGKLGLCVGAGTGLAYGLCNLPGVFNAGAAGQAALGLVACGAGCLAVLGFVQRAPKSEAGGLDYSSRGIGGWVAVFFVLVWLDSTAFYVIQHTPVLKGGTWGGDAQLYLNAVVHAGAALLAGLMLDRGMIVTTVLGAVGLLVTACVLIGAGPGYFATGAFCYAAGVSFYSAALVFYPARSGRAGLAALVYAVAGWGGSALGIGLAQNLAAVPVWMLVATGALVLSLFSARRWMCDWEKPMLLGGVILLAVGWPQGDLKAQENIELGRKVYIAEGCMHCHSQYVRPGTADEMLWGPAHPLAEVLTQSPPLLGNRRQGPDLQNVRLRRPRDWNHLHLLAPRAFMPGSRMPSYRYLFSGDAARGEALLDYLASLVPPGAARPVQ